MPLFRPAILSSASISRRRVTHPLSSLPFLPKYTNQSIGSSLTFFYFPLFQAAALTAYGSVLSLCGDLFGWQALSQHTTVYAFEFRDRSNHWGNPPSDIIPPEYTGAYHSGELDYLFNWSPDPWELTEEQAVLSEAMRAYWEAFVNGGDPGVVQGRVVGGNMSEF